MVFCTFLPLGLLFLCFSSAFGFALFKQKIAGSSKNLSRTSSCLSMSSSAALDLTNPTARDAHYGTPLNVAQYLLDLHYNKATFNFCGGMMFQLVLTDALQDHLTSVTKSKTEQQQPVIFDAAKRRMFQIPSYTKNAVADNMSLFHGREIRQVPHAEGGMGFVLQLSLANGNDQQGWTQAEIDSYDGWGHDVGRTWRKGTRLEEEGYDGFRKEFGPQSFSLHHRFYLHYDGGGRMWLSAEDGCEGTPQKAGGMVEKLQSFVFGQ